MVLMIGRRLRASAARHSPVAWRLIGGELLEAAGRYMILPFLALYLHQSKVEIQVIGLVLAAGPLANLVVGLAGGDLADRLGRRPMLLASTVLGSLTLAGFAVTTGVAALAGLHFLNTAARALYRPANAAALADVTPPELRMSAFGLRRVSLNIGAAIGPVIGFWLMALSPQLGFLTAAGVMASLGLLALVGIPETAPARHLPGSPGAAGPVARPWRQVAGDPALWLFVLCTAGYVGGTRVFTSYLPLALQGRLPDWVIPATQSLNPVLVVALQLPVNHLLRGQRPGRVLLAGSILYAVAWTGFAITQTTAGVLGMTAVLTLGEIVQAACAAPFLAMIAPAALRGRYEAAANLRELGAMVASLLAGAVLGAASFATLAALVAAAMLLAGGAGFWAGRVAAPRLAAAAIPERAPALPAARP